MPLEEIVRRAPFPLYGLGPDWTGRRQLHSAGLSLGEVTHVALTHVAGDAELVTESLFGERRAPADAPFHAALHLDADRPDEEVGEEVLDPDRVVLRHEGRWRAVFLAVDGRDQVFWWQAVGERWAAFARVGQVRVVVAATRWPLDEVRLAVVADRELYVAGSGSTTSR